MEAKTGAVPPEPILDFDLAQALALAESRNSLTELRRLEVEIAREKAEEVAGKFLSPQLHLDSYSGLVSGARGDVVTSTDNSNDFDDLGPFFKIDLKVIQPLYTFGKYTSATEAAQFNIKMQEASHREVTNELAFAVSKAFLGMVAGEDGRRVGEKLTEHYRKLMAHIEKMVEDNDPEIQDAHLLETRSMLFEITKQSSRGTGDYDQASLQLKGLLELMPDVNIKTTPPLTPVFPDSAVLLPGFLDYAQAHSWSLQVLDFGLRALQHKAELESNRKFPDIFLAAGAGYGSAPNRDKQTNPFVTDDYNYEKIGAVLGLKWDFNYQTSAAVEKQAVIDYLKLVEKRKLALLQQEGEIRKLCLAAERYWRLLNAAQDSLSAARKWLRLETDNLDLGIGDVKRLISAYKQYFLLQAEEIETRYTYHVTLAQLAKTLGNMQLYRQWETHGHVRL